MDNNNLQDSSTQTAANGSAAFESRRRFARAGLSASVVLGSLASKPVLGASYQCTVSGKASGNMSPAGPNDGMSCVTGNSRYDWIGSPAWPYPLSKGTLPNANCGFGGTGYSRGTNFNGYGTLLPVFFVPNRGQGSENQHDCSISTVISSTQAKYVATMLEVLNSASIDSKIVFGQVVVVSLLNFYQFGTAYPVDDKTIIAMFNATFNGGGYAVNGGQATWSSNDVIAYLTSLYRA